MDEAEGMGESMENVSLKDLENFAKLVQNSSSNNLMR